MKRHRKYLHLVACEVYEDQFGSLVVLADKQSGYIQFESEIEYFWEQYLSDAWTHISAPPADGHRVWKHATASY